MVARAAGARYRDITRYMLVSQATPFEGCGQVDARRSITFAESVVQLVKGGLLVKACFLGVGVYHGVDIGSA